MLTQLVRYAPVVALLREEPGTILEMGSGPDGICMYLRRPVIGLEIVFWGPPISLLRPVRGTAVNLPFKDQSVDVVLFMDTMEHIPRPLRDRCLEEAMRVARRRIIIGGPMGPRARSTDAKIAEYHRKRGLPIPPWLEEHLAEEAPDIEEIAAPLRRAGWTVRARGSENVHTHAALVKMETRRLPLRVFYRIERYATKPALALARLLRVPPYYSWVIDSSR